MCFSGRSSSSLLASDQAGTVRVWCLETRRPSASFSPSGGSEPVLCVIELCEGRWLTQAKDGSLAVWDSETACGGGERLSAVKVESHSFCKCEALDEHTVAVPAGKSGAEVALWDSRTPEVGSGRFTPLAVAAGPGGEGGAGGGGGQGGGQGGGGVQGQGPRGPTGSCMSLGVLGPWGLVGGYEDGSVQVWDVRGGPGKAVVSNRHHSEPVFGVCGAVVPDSKRGGGGRRGVVASGGADGAIAVTAWKAGDEGAVEIGEVVPIEIRTDGQRGVSSMSARPDGKVSDISDHPISPAAIHVAAADSSLRASLFP